MSSEEVLTEVIGLLTSKFAEAQSEGAKDAGLADLSLRQFTYLELIARLRNPTPTELAQKLRVSKPTVSVAIDRLEEAGYVRKAKSDEDRRSHHLHLTAKGEQFSRAHEGIHRTIVQTLITGLNDAEVAQLSALMSKVLKHITT
jgi:DNA-binding MarR family transcriptional regulator